MSDTESLTMRTREESYHQKLNQFQEKTDKKKYCGRFLTHDVDKENYGVRHHIAEFLENVYVEIVLGFLLLIDLIGTVIELLVEHLFDCEAVEEHEHHNETGMVDPKECLEYCHAHSACDLEHIIGIVSLTIVSIFLVEMLLKLLVTPKAFLSHCGNVFDLIVTAVTFLLLIFFNNSEGALLLLFRLWRFVRIGNAFLVEGEKFNEGHKLLDESKHIIKLYSTFLKQKKMLEEYNAFAENYLNSEKETKAATYLGDVSKNQNSSTYLIEGHRPESYTF